MVHDAYGGETLCYRPRMGFRAAMPIAAAVMSCVVASRSARADQTWYGSQTLISDALADGLILTGRWGRRGAFGVGIAAYLLGAPAIHGFHDEWGRAGLSLGMRAGFLMIGALAGTRCDTGGGTSKENDEDCVTEILVGSAIGIVLAQAVDAIFLAYADDDPKPMMLQLGINF